MRLTLRTLLAYLDDRLPPTNAREIGQKIAASPFATELVERIREVKRRRRLAAPTKPQPIIDANLIAEYLDDQLTPELVARVEKEVLASDAMLAEVAAAHEILGLLRDPVNVEPRLRDRLYGLDPTGNTEVIRTVGGETQPTRSQNVQSPQWKPLTSRVVSSRRMPVILAAVLGIVWIAVIASDSDLFGPRQTGSEDTNASPVAASEVADGNDPQVAASDDSGENKPGEAPVADAAAVPQGDAADTTVAQAEKGEAADGSAPAPSEPIVIADAADPAAKLTPEPGQPAPATDAPPKPEVQAVVENPAANLEPEAFHLQAESRAVLVLDEAQRRWSNLAQIPGGELVEPAANLVNCAPLLSNKWFGVPGSFRMTVRTNSRGWLANLLGPGLIQLQAGAESGLNVLSGRLLLSADASIAWNDVKPPQFALRTGSKTSLLQLQTQTTRVAIEVISVAAPDDSKAADAVAGRSILQMDSDLRVQVTALEGTIKLTTPGSNEASLLTAGKRASWSVLEMNEFSSLAVDNGPPLAAAPGWHFETDAAELPESTALKNRLLTALAGPDEPRDSVLTLMNDRNPYVGVLAVQVLSLTRDIDQLLSILYEPKDESIHRAAIDGLAAVANSSHAGRRAIQAALETRLSMPEIEPTMRLIQGINEALVADPDIATLLVSQLGNDRLATRTLAIYRLEQITKDRMGFHPDAESSRRRDAIRRWQKYLDRNSGKLVP